MKFFINTRSGAPIYKQIVNQVERGVAGGLLKPGEQLPTVRDLSLELTINPNTVARAYRELEYMGIIKSTQGRGTFVAENVPHMEQREKRLLLEKKLEEILCEAVQLGVGPSVLEDILAGVVKRFKQGDGENEL